jgi:hypothetical protein
MGAPGSAAIRLECAQLSWVIIIKERERNKGTNNNNFWKKERFLSLYFMVEMYIMTAGDLEERPAYKIELEEDGGCWNPVGQCFSFVRGGWILIRRGFLSISPPPPHTHTRIYIYTRTHSHKTSCVPCRGPGPLPPWSPWVRWDSAHLKKREREENFPLRKRVSSCCLWLNHESDATKPSSLQPVCFSSLCVLCVCVYKTLEFLDFSVDKTNKKTILSKVFFTLWTRVWFRHSAVAPTIG